MPLDDKTEVPLGAGEPASSDLTGRWVGEYQVLRCVGAGGMGEVYEGRQPLIGKRVAVKVLRPELSADDTIVKRFIQEAQAVNSIRHRGIVDIFSFGTLPGGAAYCVMEFLEGESLGEYVRRVGPLPVGEALFFIAELLDTLAAAHQAGVIHRDIKPSNLFVQTDARGRRSLKVLDFGIAKMQRASELTREFQVLGTPDYLSPEQAMGETVSPLADLYSVGVVAYVMLTGTKPFEAETAIEVMRMHVHDPPPAPSQRRPEVFPALDAFVLRCLAKTPAERFASCDDAHIEALKLLAAVGGPAGETPSGTVVPIQRTATLAPVVTPSDEPVAPRSRALLVLVAAGLAAASLGFGVVWLARAQDDMAVELPAQDPPVDPAPTLPPSPPAAAPALPTPAPLVPPVALNPEPTPRPPVGAEPARPPPKAKLTREVLARRTARVEASLGRREARLRAPDRVSRQFLATVRAAIGSAETEADLAEAAALLAELEAQLAEP